MDPHVMVALIIAFALIFDLANGWNDAANAIATVVCTRVLSPGVAVLYGATLNFVGAFFSSEVAKTVGRDIADPSFLGPATFLAAVIAAPIWITLCTLKALPISCSHSLMGALVGSVLASAGPEALKGPGLQKIIFGVFTSPVLGFIGGLIIVSLVSWIFRRVRPKVITAVFGKLQIASAGLMAFAHGTGDAQKAMGIITGALVATKFQDHWEVPFWARLACAVAMGLGTAVGGWAVIKTLGTRLAHLRPHQGFAAETAGATTILINTLTGVPISTTHSITGAIMGVGAANGVKAVRWGVGKKIIFAWVFTFPASIFGGAVVFWLLDLVGVA